MLRIGFMVCDNKKSLLYASLLNIKGIIAGTRNRTKEAYDLFEETRIIRSALLPPDHEHLANTYNNLGNELLSAGRYGEALDYYFKAINIDTKNKRRQTLHIRHLNIGSVYMFQGKFREAREQIQIGQELAAKELETSANYYDEV
jgi:tetratricopeptide (TPR) repeat protein